MEDKKVFEFNEINIQDLSEGWYKEIKNIGMTSDILLSLKDISNCVKVINLG